MFWAYVLRLGIAGPKVTYKQNMGKSGRFTSKRRKTKASPSKKIIRIKLPSRKLSKNWGGVEQESDISLDECCSTILDKAIMLREETETLLQRRESSGADTDTSYGQLCFTFEVGRLKAR